MARSCSLPVRPFCALLLVGCAQYQEFDSVGHLREQYAQRVGPEASAGIQVPFEVTPELRAVLEQRMRQAPSERSKINQVCDFIFDDLDLSTR